MQRDLLFAAELREDLHAVMSVCSGQFGIIGRGIAALAECTDMQKHGLHPAVRELLQIVPDRRAACGFIFRSEQRFCGKIRDPRRDHMPRLPLL